MSDNVLTPTEFEILIGAADMYYIRLAYAAAHAALAASEKAARETYLMYVDVADKLCKANAELAQLRSQLEQADEMIMTSTEWKFLSATARHGINKMAAELIAADARANAAEAVCKLMWTENRDSNKIADALGFWHMAGK